jgi:hypothetical protein
MKTNDLVIKINKNMFNFNKKTKLIILAGNHIEYLNWLKENDINPEETIYGSNEKTIKSVNASEVITVGSFWDRIDCLTLRDLAESRIRK